MTFRGGARLGLFNATWPFAKLSLTDDSLVLKVLFAEHSLTRVQVTRLEYFRSWFAVGVKIVHTTTSLDQDAVFWSFEPDKVLAAAARLGFDTKNEKG